MKFEMKMLGLIFGICSGNILAFDLTPDRGWMAETAGGTGAGELVVFNVGTTNFGPTNNCGSTGHIWATGQWRDENGHRIGNAVDKPSMEQYDFDKITNGWFTPGPGDPNPICEESHITRGWSDVYHGNPNPGMPPNTFVYPTYHVKVDPRNLYPEDENRTNNEVWLTSKWNGSFLNVLTDFTVLSGTRTLANSDSIYIGVFSTDNTKGNIISSGTSSAGNKLFSLTTGNSKLGFQGRRMKVTLTGGSSDKYVVKSGSKVTAEFLGQNKY